MLLTRDKFRESVFARDGHKCVFCAEPAVDAHHILERRLFTDGGYYIENGASVCEKHHLECEMTIISVEDIREACGIKKKILPSHLYVDQSYDKWGNPILSNGQRLKGELFFDESVQKILEKGNKLTSFVSYVKYPRTCHLPWSPGVSDDDRVIENLSDFHGKRVIVTEKMDGENSSLYRDHVHARSVESGGHMSRDWLKQFWSTFAHEIPKGWRICGENLFAVHSISYDNLPSYFLGFSIWNDKNVCLSWDDTLEWFELLGITPVPVLYDDVFVQPTIEKIGHKLDVSKQEGYVVRVADEIPYGHFRRKIAKYVRRGHVQTTKHWFLGQKVVKNGLSSQR